MGLSHLFTMGCGVVDGDGVCPVTPRHYQTLRRLTRTADGHRQRVRLCRRALVVYDVGGELVYYNPLAHSWVLFRRTAFERVEGIAPAGRCFSAGTDLFVWSRPVFSWRGSASPLLANALTPVSFLRRAAGTARRRVHDDAVASFVSAKTESSQRAPIAVAPGVSAGPVRNVSRDSSYRWSGVGLVRVGRSRRRIR